MDKNYFFTNIQYSSEQNEFIKKHKDTNSYKMLALYPI